jgi:secondary thiamine-phosphate synthase enzyme
LIVREAVPISHAQLGFAQSTLELKTDGACCFHDMTDAVEEFVASTGMQCGMALAQTQHTTAGLLLNECETGLRADFKQLTEQLVPSARKYTHDDFSVRWENICPEDFEAPNGHSHLQHSIFGAASIALAFADGKLQLGRWQRLFLIEYDRPRDRRVLVSAFGGTGQTENGHRRGWEERARLSAQGLA